MNNIKTLDIHAKEWFDRQNGNSYFSARVTINHTLPDEKTLVVPFQYGYGSHYETEAQQTLVDAGLINDDPHQALWRYCDENGIVLRSSKEERCRKRNCVAYGQTAEPLTQQEKNKMNAYAIDWNNIALNSEYERSLNLIEGLTFDTLMLEINCNLRVIDRETVRKQFEEDLQGRIEEARSIFEANLDNLVKQANRERNQD